MRYKNFAGGRGRDDDHRRGFVDITNLEAHSLDCEADAKRMRCPELDVGSGLSF